MVSAIKELINKIKRKKPRTYVEHFKELRLTIILSIFFTIAGVLLSYVFFMDFLTDMVMKPIEGLNAQVIFTNISESFSTEIKIAMISGVIVSFPVTLLLIWRFISPAFLAKERKTAIIAIPVSIILFGLGVSFCYYIILPLTISFFLSASSLNMNALLTVGNYVNFIFKLIVTFGIIFETPLIVYSLIKLDMISISGITKARKIVILIIVILGAVITPPDIISQILVAVPMYLMYEIGIIAGKISIGKRKRIE